MHNAGTSVAHNASPLMVFGTWTPVLTFVTPGDLSVSYTTQFGHFVRVADMVTATFLIQTSAFTFTTASGNCLITGFPFQCKTLSGYTAWGAVRWAGVTKANNTDITTQIASGATQCNFNTSGSAQARTALTAADMPTGGNVDLASTIVYQAA